MVTDGKIINWCTLQGFDGQTTRIVEQESLANVRRGRVEDPRLFRPHTMLIGPSHGPAVPFPLSTYLQSGQATRRQARFADAELAVFSEGEEWVDGLDCVEVRIEYWSDAWKERVPELRWLWLAVDRNYLPVRTTALFRGFPRDHPPPEVGRAWDFRELAPGVWLPFRASSTVYKGTRVGQVDPNVVSRKWDWTIDEARLDPHYDVSLFRDIPIPDGMPVFEVAPDGAILRKYVQGAVESKPGSRSSRGWILAPVVLLLAVGVWAFRRCRSISPRTEANSLVEHHP